MIQQIKTQVVKKTTLNSTTTNSPVNPHMNSKSERLE